MPSQHGYSPIGTRYFGQQDWGVKGRTNVTGALLSSLLLTVTLLTSNVNNAINLMIPTFVKGGSQVT